MLEIIVCEDNEAALNELCKTIERMIENNNLNCGVVLKAQNAELVEKFVENDIKPAQLYIIDIILDNSPFNGYELAKRIREKEKALMQPKSYILFISGITYKYMALGYDVQAYNCLQKPVQKHVLEDVLLDIYGDYLVKEATNNVKNPFIKIKSGPEVYSLKCDDIVFIERNKFTRKTRIVTDKLDIECRDPIHQYEEVLKGTNVVKCNRSLFINRSRIASVNTSKKTVNVVLKEGKQQSFKYASGYESEIGV